MEFKNIASYPMDFNAEEIVGRFVDFIGYLIAVSRTDLRQFVICTDGETTPDFV